MLVRHAFGSKAIARQPSLLNACSYRPRVGVYNTDRRLLAAVARHTGINRIYTHTKKLRANQRNLSYEWRANTSELVWLLPQVLPWLVIKRKQVELLMQYFTELDRRRPVPGERWEHLRDPDRRRKSNNKVESIAKRINNLNRRGRHIGPVKELV